MAARGGEQPLAVVAIDEARLRLARDVAREPEPRGRAISFWLYWSHLFCLFGLAASNVLLGLGVLASPFSGGLRRLASRRVRPLLALLLVYVALMWVAIAFSFDPRRSLGETGELFSLLALPLALVVVSSERQVRWVIDAMVLLATFESLVGLGQIFAAGGVDLSRRIVGTTSHYMTFSGMLMVADLLVLAQLATLDRASLKGPQGWASWRNFLRGRPGWRLLALLPINVALLASLTRSAWLGVFAGLAILLLASKSRLLLWSVPAALLLLLMLPGQVLQRVVSIGDPTDPSNVDRRAMARAGIAMVAERPLVGQGPAMVAERYQLFRVPEAVRSWVPHLHDSYLEVAAERGLPSLVALLALLGFPFWRAFRLLRREGGRKGERADLYLGVMAALIGFAAAAVFEDNWGDTEVQRLVLALLAIPFVLADAVEPSAPRGLAPVSPFRSDDGPRR